MKRTIFFFFVIVPHFVLSQDVTIQVNTLNNQRKVSPYIYGRNAEFSDNPNAPTSPALINLYKDGGIRFSRMNGGNNCTKYNWRKKMTCHPDWYNNIYNHDWDYAAKSIEANTPGMQTMFGFQLIGWAASNTNNNFDDWTYNQAQFWDGVSQNLAGGGTPNAAGGSKALKEGDPNKYLIRWTPDSTTGILDHWFGQGGLNLKKENLLYWNMDNEIEIWPGTHDDVMPTQITADSLMKAYFATAKLARAKFPNIKLVGPAPANEWQWYDFATQTLTINGKSYCWLEYFIKRIADEQKATGIRLLDAVDIHFYASDTNDKLVQYYRVFFDKNYTFPGASGVHKANGGWDSNLNQEYILQRIRDWLDLHMGPNNGVGVGVSESGFFVDDANINAVIYASTLGTFAEHEVEFYTPWVWNLGMWEVAHLFSRNAKSISVETKSSLDTYVSGYSTVTNAADSMTVILVNRDLNAAHKTTINISDFAVFDGAYASLQLVNLPASETFKSHSQNALQKGSVNVSSDAFTVSLPPLSVTAIILKNKSTIKYTLVTAASPSTGGTVSGAGTYTAGTTVTPKATPAAGYTFTGWSGDASGTNASVAVTMNSNKSITANFQAIKYTLATTVSPVAGGSVSGAGMYAAGTKATLTATPAAGYTFTGWSGDASGTAASMAITMDGDKSVTANFQSQTTTTKYSLATTASPIAGGNISGAGTYDAGTVATLTATPAPGYTFIGWSGDASGASASTAITMTSDKSVTANFQVAGNTSYALSAMVIPAGGGVVTGAGTYPAGAVVVIEAEAAAGYTFVGWSGDIAGTDASQTITMSGDVAVQANFQSIEEFVIKIPKLFSPDNRGDISTETWNIENAQLLDGCEMVIYNRQGQKVYSSLGYPTPWDGTSNGRPLPDGAYFYIIRYPDNKKQAGSVTIARLK